MNNFACPQCGKKRFVVILIRDDVFDLESGLVEEGNVEINELAGLRCYDCQHDMNDDECRALFDEFARREM